MTRHLLKVNMVGWKNPQRSVFVHDALAFGNLGNENVGNENKPFSFIFYCLMRLCKVDQHQNKVIFHSTSTMVEIIFNAFYKISHRKNV